MWVLSALAAPIGEVEVYAPSLELRAEAEALGLVFAEGVDGPWVRYHGDAEALDAAGGMSTRNLRSDHRTLLRQDGYHTPETVNERLAELAEDPRVELVALGESVQGRPLVGLRMGSSELPAIRILGLHHGDELSSSELALAIAAALLQSPLLERWQVWILPTVNPDGMAAGSRYNANDVDLNRNYDFMWAQGFTHGSAPFSEPETRAVRTLSLYTPFVFGLSLHSGAENIGYPWNWSYDDTPDEGRLRELSDRYTDACAVDEFYTTNGADWYVTEGDTNDWSLGRQGTWDFTVELSEVKAPPSADLPALLEAHLAAVWALMEVPVPVQGRVVDSETGKPVQAVVDVRSSSTLWTGPDGRFARALEVGVYELSVHAPGYAEQVVSVGVPADGEVRVDVALVRESVADGSVWPTLVSQGAGEVELHVEGLDPLPRFLLLSRPGFESVEIERDNGVYPLRPSLLEQGPWSLQSEGTVFRNALLVGAPDGLVSVSSATRADGKVLLHGEGFGAGSRAFALFGHDRNLVALPRLYEDDRWLRFDASLLPDEGTVDLLVLSNGRELGVADLLGTTALDTAWPADEDTAEPVWGELVPAGYRGCQSTGGSWSAALLTLLALVRRLR